MQSVVFMSIFDMLCTTSSVYPESTIESLHCTSFVQFSSVSLDKFGTCKLPTKCTARKKSYNQKANRWVINLLWGPSQLYAQVLF